MILESQSLINRLMTEEKERFLESTQLSCAVPSSHEDYSVIYEVPTNSESIKDLLEKNKNVSTTLKYDIEDPTFAHTYFKDLSTSILEIDKELSLQDAIKTLYELSTIMPDFAGAILKPIGTKYLINPLHPLVSLSLLELKSIPTLYKLIVYKYTDKQSLLKYETDIDTDRIKENIKLLIRTYTNKIVERKYQVIASTIEQDTLVVKYQIEKQPEEDPNNEFVLVTHQVLTEGVFVPYYGTSLLKVVVGKIQGTHLSPHCSANIGKTSFDSSQVYFSGICTGSESQRHIKGWKTLTHSNLYSPLNHDCMLNGSMAYIDACIKQSFEIYKLGEII